MTPPSASAPPVTGSPVTQPPLTGPRIVLLANHQHVGLAAAFGALHPAALIASFDLVRLSRDEAARAVALEAVAAADHIIAHDAPSSFGPLATGALRAAQRPLHLLPSFRFAGFHPDATQIARDGARLAGPTGATHSRLAIAAYLGGLDTAATLDLFNGLAFARLGYFSAFAEQRALLLQTFAAYGFDLAPLFPAWHHAGCFMFDATHPRMRVLLDLARLLSDRMGLAPENPAATEADVPNPLATHPTHPLFPEIAARLGVSPEGTFRGPIVPDRKPVLFSLEQFIRASFAAYRHAPLAALRGVPGMAAAMRALRLAEADFGRAAATARAAAAAPDDVVLLGWHGGLLGIETASSLLVQTPPWPASPDSVPAAFRADLPIDAPLRAAMAGGTDIAPGPRPLTVTLSQNQLFLSVPPTRMAPRFGATSAAEAETFLAIRRDDLALLRALAGAAWNEAGDAEQRRLSGAGLRLHRGFRVTFGPHEFDLANTRLARSEAPQGIALHAGDKSFVFTQDPTPDIADDLAIEQQVEVGRLPEAASLEQFRLWPGHRLHVQGPPELIHLPLAVDNASRAWLHAKHFDGNPLRVGRHPLHATPTRGADKFVMLSRGAEGIIVDTEGTWARRGFLDRGTKLPPGLRHQDRAVLLSRAAAAEAPRLSGPHCVFYNANLQNWYHWVVEAAVTLHVLQPVLPPETTLLIPPTLAEFRARGGIDHMGLLAALGFTGMRMHEATAPLVHAADLTWLENDYVGIMPAGLLQSFRARAHTMRPPAALRRRLYITRRRKRRVLDTPAISNFMRLHRFEPVDPEDLAPAQQIDLFAAAEFVIAPHGAALSNLLFCQPGTRVLELSPDVEFRPFFWHVSEKLGLFHAVLPCPTHDGTFQGNLNVDPDRLRAIFRLLNSIDP